jgi:hypothetical protein
MFAGARAVIVGGSRGLGETTAELIAAGGGHVVLTWHHGERDARAVADDVRSMGGSVEVIHLDTSAPDLASDAVAGATHLYFFASPRITARRLTAFDRSVFERFVDVVEYAAAKAAGEVSARAWSTARRGTSIVVRRLPRTATDQTASTSVVECADTVTTMRDVVREMHRSS